jgi:hypothetical protein
MLHFTNVRVRVWFQGVIAQGGWWVDGALLNTFVDRLLLMTKNCIRPPA